MTAATPDSETQINAYHDEHGAAWGLIEYSGQDREKHTGALFGCHGEASQYRGQNYSNREIDELAVCVARWDREGEFWSYDY